MAREADDHLIETQALIGLAAHAGPSEHGEARTAAEEALGRSRRAGYRMLEGQARTAIAGILLAQGDADQAAQHAEQALAVHRETGHRLGEANTHLVLGHALHLDGQAAMAAAHWTEALNLFTEIGTPEADEVRALLRA